jgi:hypothetical protein
MAISVKDAVKRSALKARFDIIRIRGDDSPVEDLAAGEVGVQVDVGGQNEVLT